MENSFFILQKVPPIGKQLPTPLAPGNTDFLHASTDCLVLSGFQINKQKLAIYVLFCLNFLFSIVLICIHVVVYVISLSLIVESHCMYRPLFVYLFTCFCSDNYKYARFTQVFVYECRLSFHLGKHKCRIMVPYIKFYLTSKIITNDLSKEVVIFCIPTNIL